MNSEAVGPDSFGGEDFPSNLPLPGAIDDQAKYAEAIKSGALTEIKSDVPMFSFEGSEYPYFVANRTGNVGVEVKNPATDKPAAIVGANFMWSDVEPFLKHQDLGTKEVRNVREDETYKKRGSMTTNNARLFRETVQNGYVIPYDESGEPGTEEPKTRDELLAYSPEIQSLLINEWIGNFHIERYFPDGAPSLTALLSTPETVWFKALIGDRKNPAHVLVFEYNVPNPDARRAYETDTFAAATKQEGENIVSTYAIDYAAKYRFGRKYLKSVRGAAIAKDGEINVDSADISVVDSDDQIALANFGKGFHPTWFIRMADALAGAFEIAGK